MPNALIQETSPYLLQHAHNPVDWLPWGEEAFARARAADKLVFVSVGYSTCHWCHVMERECFENERIAQVMNHHFINVKVDREERPDIDATYMAYLQATTGQGGWPMSVWLTPEGSPVFGGTYFPPDDRHGRPGFTRVCHELARVWRDDRGHLEAIASRAMEHLRRETSAHPVRGMPSSKVFGDFLDRCDAMFDAELGGFGDAPKFPRPVVLKALMQLVDRFGRDSDEGRMAREMAERTLLAMAAGGIHDQLGGGFHRYSVDRWWHVPHYEKMLYDQAQLAMAFLDGWQLTGNETLRSATEGIFRYLIGTMRDDGGAFHAAEDADSLPSPDAAHPLEGAFWTWEADEIQRLLNPRDAAMLCAAYGVEVGGNARPESDPHGELTGRNTLYRAMHRDDLAVMFDAPVDEIEERLAAASAALLQARSLRPPPHRDDKILTAWNGLAIAALARGARLLGRADLCNAARAAASFLRRELWDGARLFRSHRGRRSEASGFPADHVCLIAGLIELHAVDRSQDWLAFAVEVQCALDRDYWNEERAGYVMRPQLGERELMVIREDHDGAEPAPNHLAAETLLKLAALTGENDYATRAEALLRAGASMLEAHPFAAPQLLCALDLHERGVMTIHVPHVMTDAAAASLRSHYLPRAAFTHTDGDDILLCEGQQCRIWEME
jgi:uncharacterized protein YyaL (SSP411 family)